MMLKVKANKNNRNKVQIKCERMGLKTAQNLQNPIRAIEFE